MKCTTDGGNNKYVCVFEQLCITMCVCKRAAALPWDNDGFVCNGTFWLLGEMYFVLKIREKRNPFILFFFAITARFPKHPPNAYRKEIAMVIFRVGFFTRLSFSHNSNSSRNIARVSSTGQIGVFFHFYIEETTRIFL